ncbi:putative Succinyl-CoA ligase [GDP-forming] subunit beta [Cardiosporidium cionae]|uniref:Succinate--CoA ligase [ADP-forming] subunit beta, mitochondrial n=1 Tax=Cardiosporidium cionae TaxID=476202 RepID=A0ABQ7JA65_9APIC|nr:putative Succinyl-CoA ligase [GDP-forming] subunit beta [Cardiosporidium cionae]|eukprot:KAF8820872.1 putative Succinyl-CoA ligase [GDP-forming] subunit beta [Cardiosporidium cionae]
MMVPFKCFSNSGLASLRNQFSGQCPQALSSFSSVTMKKASFCSRTCCCSTITTAASLPSIKSNAILLPASNYAESYNLYWGQRRFLNLHEYQSKKLLKDFGLTVQKGKVANTVEEAYAVAKDLKDNGATELILKCQIKAGGRGKGHLTSGLKGGVQICTTPEEVQNFAKQMIGYRLMTHQTSKEGELVQQVLVHEGVNITKELYLAIVLDRAVNGPAVVASRIGGMDIEEVARDQPDAIAIFPININEGLSRVDCFKIAAQLGFATDFVTYPSAVVDQIQRLYDLFIKCDSTQVEINPFAVIDTGDDQVVCVDAKIQFDDSAAYRQKDLFSLEDTEGRDPKELAAEKAGLNFVSLDGNIGCLVNGAGLAMATMDIVKLHGGSPANFLDVGGGADAVQVAEAFRILQSDNQVKALFVNIFGGIMRCDIIAEGLVTAAQEVSLRVPLVVRLCGNRVEKGRKILESSGIQCLVIDSLEEAAKAVCSFVKA